MAARQIYAKRADRCRPPHALSREACWSAIAAAAQSELPWARWRLRWRPARTVHTGRSELLESQEELIGPPFDGGIRGVAPVVVGRLVQQRTFAHQRETGRGHF